MTLRILATGGTLDKHYNELNGELTFSETHLTEIIALSRNTLPIIIETVMLIDSLDMQHPHRQQILERCEAAAEKYIVITHGTDTMPETARMLGEAISQKQLNKTIVLTGAMLPYELKNSDAVFNLGFAIGVAQTLENGVYIAMNGQIFAWDNVMKNRAVGIFSDLPTEK